MLEAVTVERHMNTASPMEAVSTANWRRHASPADQQGQDISARTAHARGSHAPHRIHPNKVDIRHTLTGDRCCALRGRNQAQRDTQDGTARRGPSSWDYPSPVRKAQTPQRPDEAHVSLQGAARGHRLGEPRPSRALDGQKARTRTNGTTPAFCHI